MRVAIFAGHSGGHLFPAIAFSEAFKEKYPEAVLCLVTSRKGERFLKNYRSLFQELEFCPNFPAPSGLSLNSLLFLIQLAQGFWHASRFLKRFKPDLSVGFGSYVSYPGIFLSRSYKIPTLIHEQNVIPGKTTVMLAERADCVTVSFEETKKYLPRHDVYSVGLPIRNSLKTAAEPIKSTPSIFTVENPCKILIVGGSQGSISLNRIVLNAFSQFSTEEKKKTVVTHITGKQDFDLIQNQYSQLALTAKVFEFQDNMNALYQDADIAITRAGANTLFELALFQVPAIVIPYPYADAHQIKNAEVFVGQPTVFALEEKRLTADLMAQKILELINRSELRIQMMTKARELHVFDAGKKMVEISQSLLRNNSKETKKVLEAGVRV